jgi:hemerythrin-like metal-binding protein
MTFIAWDDSLGLHIDMIDEEHKALINIMNNLYEQNKAGESKETIKATLSELSAFATLHFSDEEDYMASIKFPDLEVHRAIHQRLLQKINDFSREYCYDSEKIPDDFFTFLKIWINSHIKGVDIKYANAS